jgi:NAD(P)-dependent dehydrogenase (short-subunit alcohol dehydrogenase family)
MAKMEGKNVVVTGSGTGIGRGIALEFAREGANVVFHYAHAADGATSGVEEARRLGVKSAAFQADFSSIEQVLRLADEALAFLGRVDILINNAGITLNKPFFAVEPSQYNRLFDVNMRAQFFLTQRIGKDMLAHEGGAVCNITSIHGVSGAPEHAVYAGTKGAIIAYTRALGVELAHKGIRVNAIAPGWVAVENHAKAIPDYDEEKMKEAAYNMVPAGFYGLPVDIARLAIFLCSGEARFIVGQTFVCDGGSSSLMSLISDFRHESTARFGVQYM